MSLTVSPPDVNRSVHEFTVVDDQTLRYGLGALKGLGRSAIEGIVAEREAGGPFASLPDFCVRVDLHRVNRRALETLIRSGAMDPLEDDANRARLLNALDTVLHAAEQSQRDREAGQCDMFGSGGDSGPAAIDVDMPAHAPWPELQRLYAEKEALGLFLTGHPALVHRPDLKRFTTCKLDKVRERVPPSAEGRRSRGVDMTLAGLVSALRRSSRRGRFVTIEDHSGRLEVALFDEAFSRYAELLAKDEMVVVEGRVSADDFSGGYRMSASRVMSLGEAKARFASGVSLSVQGPCDDLADQLGATFAPYRGGGGDVYVEYRNQRARASLRLGDDWKLRSCEELIAALGDLEPVVSARLIY